MDAKAYAVHLGLLIHRAPEFAEKVLGPHVVKDYRIPGDDAVYHLPGKNARTFAMFYAWLYIGDVLPPSDEVFEENGFEIREQSVQTRLVPGPWATDAVNWHEEDLMDM